MKYLTFCRLIRTRFFLIFHTIPLIFFLNPAALLLASSVATLASAFRTLIGILVIDIFLRSLFGNFCLNLIIVGALITSLAQKVVGPTKMQFAGRLRLKPFLKRSSRTTYQYFINIRKAGYLLFFIWINCHTISY